MNTEKQPRMTRATKVLSLTAIAIFLVSLDTSIVVVAQRRIEEDLGDIASYPGRQAFYNLK